MTADVARYQPTTDIAPAPFSAGGNLIREAAAVMADAHMLAKAICNTQMIPQHFKGKPDECAAAMLYGASLGLDPMQAVKGIYVVHGSAALYARTMASIVLRDQHELWTVESTNEAVTVAGRRRGTDRVEQSTWTYERAQLAGYTSNAKYKTDPQAMLYAKAVSEVCRKIAPDSLAGVYAVEELQLEKVRPGADDRPARAVTAATFTSVTAAKPEPAPAPADEPPADDPLTDVQRDTLTALFDEAGIPAENQRAYIADRLERSDNRRKLTAAEADAVIAHLRHDMAQEAATEHGQEEPDADQP